MADDENDRTEDVRADETQGIDRSEQPGLGGGSSVFEQYGKDTEPDDAPERPEPSEEPTLPGSDPEMPRDLEAERGPPDADLPPPGHEIAGPLPEAAEVRRHEAGGDGQD